VPWTGVSRGEILFEDKEALSVVEDPVLSWRDELGRSLDGWKIRLEIDLDVIPTGGRLIGRSPSAKSKESIATSY